jgi:hypothetical protein
MPLALIAVVCLAHLIVRRASASEIAKTCILAAAFLFWAANQFWPEHPMATRFNDLAVALFVLDVIFTIVTWSSAGGLPGEEETAYENRTQRPSDGALDASASDGQQR